jgi:hypothetical protein
VAEGDSVVKGIDFRFEWEDPRGAAGPELRATWARLEITVNDSLVTRVLDSRAGSLRSGVYLPLYPLAEWIAVHWWPLLHEVENPHRALDGYSRRHSLRFAREGFALPDMSLNPLNDRIEVVWEEAEPPDSGLRFIERGREVLDAEVVEESLRRFIEVVIRRLDDQAVSNSFLHGEWSASVLDEEEERFCRLAGILGLDPFSLSTQEEDQILKAAQDLEPAFIEEFFGAASQDTLLEQVALVRKGIDAARARAYDLRPLRKLRDAIGKTAGTGTTPWDEGYSFARRLREELELGERTARSMEELADILSVNFEELEQALVDRRYVELGPSVPSWARFLDSIVGIDPSGSPGFLIMKSLPGSRMFAFCRAVFEYLTAAGAEAMLTFSRSFRQQRNRAFAAEFLAPSDVLRQRISGEIVDDEEVEELAGQFGVSAYVIRHQLENHSLARIRS